MGNCPIKDLILFDRYSPEGEENYSDPQWAFLTSTEKEVAFVSGMGGGKTYIFLRQVLYQHVSAIIPATGESYGYVIYPTLTMAKELFWEDFQKILKQSNIKITKSSATDMYIFTKYGKIFVKTLQYPERIVGGSASFVAFDEFDIVNTDKSKKGYDMAIGRMRGSNNSRLFIVTTPEGFKATYDLFGKKTAEQLKEENKRLIQGSTRDNAHRLDPDYIPRMMRVYSDEQANAYIDGEFVNLNSGQVYEFNRKKHIQKIEIENKKTVYVSCDFNLSPCVFTLAQVDNPLPEILYHGDVFDSFSTKVRVFDEVVITKNASTADMAIKLGHTLIEYGFSDIIITGDASGGNRLSTQGTASDYTIIINELLNLGFSQEKIKLNIKKANPRIRATVNEVNYLFRDSRLIISEKCKLLVNDLERVVFDDKGEIDKTNKDLTHASDTLRYLCNLVAPIQIKNKKEE